MQADIESRIVALVSDAVLRPVGLDEELLESGLLDSIASVDLALQVEQEFGIEIPATHVQTILHTSRCLVEHIRRAKPVG